MIYFNHCLGRGVDDGDKLVCFRYSSNESVKGGFSQQMDRYSLFVSNFSMKKGGIICLVGRGKS